MTRILTVLGAVALLAFTTTAATADEAVARKMAELLPQAPQGWTTQGPQVQTIKEGPAKGGMAFQMYQAPEKKRVLVRFVQNTPPQFKQAIDDPGSFKFQGVKVGDRKAAVRQTDKGGSLIVVAGERLAMVEWSPETSRAEAMQYAQALDLDALTKVQSPSAR